MSKKPASLTSDLLARKGEAEPSTIDPAARMTLSAGPGFSSYGGSGRDGEGEGEAARPRPPEPEIIYTAEETGSGGGATRLIIAAVLGVIIVGGIFLATTGNQERGVAPVSPDIAAQAPAPAETPATAPADQAAPAAPETLTTVPAAPGQSAMQQPPSELRPGAESAPSSAAPAAPAAPSSTVPAIEVPTAPVEAAKPVEEAAPAEKPVVAAAPSSKGAYVVQLFALKDEAAARASWTKIMKSHSAILGGHALDIEKADLGEKGTWYRVRAAGFATKSAAASACTKLKAAGQDCMVKKR
jgi:cell division septation protein DedD